MLRGLLAAGYPVRALVRWPDSRLDGCETVVGDLRRAGDLVPALRGCRYVVHCAALYSFAPSDRRSIREINVAGTAGLAESARIAEVERLVVTSSSATVGPARNGRLPTEDDWAVADGRHSTYHRSKIDQERAALAGRVPVVIVLPTTPVGPGDWKPTPTGRLVLDFARGRVFAGPPDGGLNLVPVEDVARAHVLALERGRPGERYLIGGENLTLRQVWELLEDVTGKRAPRWRVPYAMAVAFGVADEIRCRLRPGSQPAVPLEGVRMSRERMHVDCAKAVRELGFRSGGAREALRRAVAWYRENGYVA